MSTHLVLFSPYTEFELSSSLGKLCTNSLFFFCLTIPSTVTHVDRLGGKIIRSGWVTDCWREKRRLDECLYYVFSKHFLAEESSDDEDVSGENSDFEEATESMQEVATGAQLTIASSSSAVRELPSIFQGIKVHFYGHKKKQTNFHETNKVRNHAS